MSGGGGGRNQIQASKKAKKRVNNTRTEDV